MSRPGWASDLSERQRKIQRACEAKPYGSYDWWWKVVMEGASNQPPQGGFYGVERVSGRELRLLGF